MPSETMTRGVLAKRTGIGPETIRYYERIGLLDEPLRNVSGYRIYDTADLSRLAFIRRAQELGFSLEDVRELLALRLKQVAECSHVERSATRRLVDVRKRIRDLEQMEQGLRELIASCRANPFKATCPIYEVLEATDEDGTDR
jgi:MerR family transcriptional regulator, copper efflux regulator